jgi:crotonobetainyl-CoA:carnitine CoA-transferase CaiB-like acyl-CoA transferase
MTGTAGPRMLAGLRVLDLAGDALAYAGRVLADLGADVVLVEKPGGDERRSHPPAGATPDGRMVSAHFAAMAAGKRSLTLDRAAPEGREILEELLGRADVLLSTDDVDDLSRAGLLPADVLRRHPRLVFASATPFGLQGPRRRWKGSDLVAWATSAAMPSQGDPDRAPLAPAGGLADTASSVNALAAVLVALRARRRTGHGQLVDISRQEAMMSCAMEAGPPVDLDLGRLAMRNGNRKPNPPTGHYRTADGAVSLVAFMDQHWDALAAWIRDETGNTEVTDDGLRGPPINRRHVAKQVDAWIEELTTRYRKQEFADAAQARGIPCMPVNSLSDLLQDPHLRAADAWTALDISGFGPLRIVKPPLVFDGQRADAGSVPEPGADTDAILRADLSASDGQIARWRAEKIV